MAEFFESLVGLLCMLDSEAAAIRMDLKRALIKLDEMESAMGKLQDDIVRLKNENANLKNENANLKKDNARLEAIPCGWTWAGVPAACTGSPPKSTGRPCRTPRMYTW